MAHTCAICGAEINMLQSQKLADGNYICRKTCQKKGMKKYFSFMHASLDEVNAHIAQVENGTKIFNDLFVPKLKASKKQRPVQFGGDIYVLEDLGLIALAKAEYKHFIFGKYYPQACVFRLGDLVGYSPEKIDKLPDGTSADASKKYIHFVFRNTDGLCDFYYDYNTPKKLSDYFNKLFGIQKTLGNIGNTWKNQINAAKAMAAGVKAATSGAEDAKEKAMEAANSLDVFTITSDEWNSISFVQKCDNVTNNFLF